MDGYRRKDAVSVLLSVRIRPSFLKFVRLFVCPEHSFVHLTRHDNYSAAGGPTAHVIKQDARALSDLCVQIGKRKQD